MVDAKVLKRFVQLIEAGENVLATKRPPPRNVVMNDSVDTAMFQQWRMSVLSLLSATFTQNSIHFKEFQEKCEDNWHYHAVQGLAILKAAKEDIEQEIDSAPPGRINIEDLFLHTRIAEVSLDLYRDGHYADAVLAASKALINYVKERSRRDDLDGAPLMQTVFSVNNPILAFNDMTAKADQDEQQGMMYLFTGAVLSIRNPRGHEFPDDSPERALEYISFISLLANRLGEAKMLEKR